METVEVELPAALVKAAEFEPSCVSREAAKLLALELFREERVSLARAAQLSETPPGTALLRSAAVLRNWKTIADRLMN
jgi:predicted HTH domain antitoxin